MIQLCPRSTQRFAPGRAAIETHGLPRSAADGQRVVDDAGAVEVAQQEIDPAVVLDGKELAHAARGHRPLQPLVGPQIAVAALHARHQHDDAADGGDGPLRPDRDGNGVLEIESGRAWAP